MVVARHCRPGNRIAVGGMITQPGRGSVPVIHGKAKRGGRVLSVTSVGPRVGATCGPTVPSRGMWLFQ